MTTVSRERVRGKVKGILMIPWVKIIRSDKTGLFDKWIEEEDKEFLTRRLFPSSWYPFSSYMHFFSAVAEVGANGDEQTIYNWGYDFSVELLTSTYKNMIVPNDPLKSIEKSISLLGLLFDSGRLEKKTIGKKSIELHATGFPKDFKYFYCLMRGWNARVIAISGAESVNSQFTLKSWEGAPKTVIEYRFS
jgi:hypothetical protein